MRSDIEADLQKYLFAISICELVVGFAGNLTACIVIWCSTSMRTLTDFYLLSLSASDLLILIMGIPLDIYLFYLPVKFDEYHFHDNALTYSLHQWILQTAVHASILTVTAFTAERYLAICHPFTVKSMATISRAKKIIATIWTVAAVLALLSAVELFFTIDRLKPGFYKPLPKTFADVWPYMVYIRVVVYFVLPMLLITVMYTLIGLKLSRNSIERRNTFQAERTNTKALKMFAVIILLFFISWAPTYLYEMIWYYTLSTDEYHEAELYIRIVNLFTYALSPALNPIIYVIMSRKFRKAFKNLLSKSRKRLSDWTYTTTNIQMDGELDK